jgi:hypothetical protein
VPCQDREIAAGWRVSVKLDITHSEIVWETSHRQAVQCARAIFPFLCESAVAASDGTSNIAAVVEVEVL